MSDNRGIDGRGVPLVEDQVNNREHSSKSCRQLLRRGHIVWHAAVLEAAFGTGDALFDRARRDKKRTGNLANREPAQYLQGESDLRFAFQGWMTADEDETDEIVRQHQILRLERAVLRGVIGSYGLGVLPLDRQTPESVNRLVVRRLH